MLSVTAKERPKRYDSAAEIRILLVENPAWISDYLNAFGLAPEDSGAADTVFRQVDDSLAGTGGGRSKAQWRAAVAQTPVSAVEACAQALDADRPFHLAFIDSELNGPETGITLANRLWSLDPRLFVVLSGPRGAWSPLALPEQAGWAGKLLLLAKPFFGWEAVHAALHAKALHDEAASLGAQVAPVSSGEPSGVLPAPFAMARFDAHGRPLAVNEAFRRYHPDLTSQGRQALTLDNVLQRPPFSAIEGSPEEDEKSWSLHRLPDGSTRAAVFVCERDGRHLLAEIDLTGEIARLAELQRIDARDSAMAQWDKLLDALFGAEKPKAASGATVAPAAARLRAATCGEALTPEHVHPGRAVAEAAERVAGRTIDLDLCEAHRSWQALADKAEIHESLSLLLQGLAESAEGPLRVEAETVNVRLDDTAAARLRRPGGDYVRLTLHIHGGCGVQGDLDDLLNPLGLTEQDQGKRLGLLRCYSFARRSGGHLDVIPEKDGLRIDLLLPRAGAAQRDGERGAEGSLDRRGRHAR